MQLTLLIPDLLPPPGAEGFAGAAAPVLRRMLGRGEQRHFPAIECEAWLCQAFEVERQSGWPVAALTAAIDGLPADTGTWLRADPVHLQLQRDRTLLLAAPALSLSGGEAAALVDALNLHFSGDGLEFSAPHPSRWYLAHEDAASVDSPALSAAAGKPLPRTRNPGRWHRLLTEIQMLLHAHPVNAAREQRGQPAINSLLLWGAGRKPAVPGRHYSHVWSNDPLASALAVLGGAESGSMPARASDWLASAAAGGARARHLVMLDHAHLASRYGGPAAWLDAVETLEEQWFSPLWQLAGRAPKLIDIVATQPEHCLRLKLRPADRLKFWRRSPSWSALPYGANGQQVRD